MFRSIASRGPRRQIIGALAGAAALLTVGAAAAQAAGYNCTLAPNSETALMPPQIIIQFRGTAQAEVAHGWQDGPVTHSVAIETGSNRQSFSFRVPASIRSTTVMMIYQATIFPARNEMVLNAAAGSGWSGRATGRYRCSDL
jgi:hypothetical protein